MQRLLEDLPHDIVHLAGRQAGVFIHDRAGIQQVGPICIKFHIFFLLRIELVVAYYKGHMVPRVGLEPTSIAAAGFGPAESSIAPPGRISAPSEGSCAGLFSVVPPDLPAQLVVVGLFATAVAFFHEL